MFKLDKVTCQGHFCSVSSKSSEQCWEFNVSLPYHFPPALVGPSPRGQILHASGGGIRQEKTTRSNMWLCQAVLLSVLPTHVITNLTISAKVEKERGRGSSLWPCLLSSRDRSSFKNKILLMTPLCWLSHSNLKIEKGAVLSSALTLLELNRSHTNTLC